MSDEDDFFGNDDDNNDTMAQRDTLAAEARIESVAYLDAFEATKETRLQEGFEAGYVQVHEIAERLGQRLGQIVARAKIEELLLGQEQTQTTQLQKQAQEVARRYRLVMGRINKGPGEEEANNNDDDDTAKEMLLSLEQEMDQILVGQHREQQG